MTGPSGFPSLPDAVLRSWPGRFRSSEIMLRLHGAGQDAGSQDADRDLGVAMLAGIAAAQDESAALAKLVSEGEFDVAELMLAQCESLSARVVRQAAKAIESGRCEVASSLTERARRLQDLADAAGVRFDPLEEDVERLGFGSRRAASQLLDRQEKDLVAAVDERVAEVRRRLEAAQLPEETARMVKSLLASRRVRAASSALENGTLDLPGPEIQPPLPQWLWQEPPLEVLSWHIDRNIPRSQTRFASWMPPDDTGQRLLTALDELNHVGGEEVARTFVTALETFLAPDGATPQGETPVVHAVSGGFLTSVRNVFASDLLARFHPTSRVPLFVVDPGQDVPPDVAGVGHFIAVGPKLEPAGRGMCAVLSVRDLLRLATVGFGRDVSVARVVGRQWTLAGFGVSSAAALKRLLGETEERRWQTLCWLADLTGLGGSATADALLFQSGGDPGVLYLLLDYLLSQETRQQMARQQAQQSALGALSAWVNDKQTADRVEAEMLRDGGSPAVRAAFWTASAAAPPGTSLSLDALVLAASLLESDVSWEAPLRAGFDQLARQWYAGPGEQNTVFLRRIGVTIGLRQLAEQRLGELGAELRTPASPPSLRPGPGEWTAYRFAPGPGWPAYRELSHSGTTDSDELATARAGLEVPVDLLITESATLTGESDLMSVVAELRDVLRAEYPGVTLDVDGPPEADSEVNERIALALLGELMRNAVEAIGGIGTVAVTVRPAGADVIVDVRDTGDGLAGEIDSGFRVFRRGFSTWGIGRGDGLFLVRQLVEQAGGDVELVSRAASHPVLHGAHFRLVLPSRP